MERLLPQLALDLSEPLSDDPAELFAARVDDVRLEIGFGGGEHLIHEARKAPSCGFFGVEPFVNGMAKAVAAIEGEELTNIRLYDGDAADLLDWLPSKSLLRVDLLYPDPWPKRRHWKRRFVNAENLARIHRALRPGGVFRFASDIPSYVDWTMIRVLRHGGFVWPAETVADWHEPYPGWPGTRYEAKALREGRRPAYLSFSKR
ncbi:tRNA (guanine-N7-)-methyltransferase [Rhodopseudomonas julia]|uniref:tRNA (guanine-N(7)-)-methyltransferase n=1 Tax=Rhodopseudomonas julia TaxID=200617 RepID=A0ABU0C6R3_9BRAD|nr:tRNA (guanine(46)-N(7))-methyltransferase TrmB [Rhodopseudomonas julia]MDQ0325325.1 tRNA (guanine-N7-)-methyltransferase [Rhodopseudomonas julia]